MKPVGRLQRDNPLAFLAFADGISQHGESSRPRLTPDRALCPSC